MKKEKENSYEKFIELKTEASDYIRSTGKFKTPTNLKNHGDEWYGNGMIIWFEPNSDDGKIIARLNNSGDVKYMNLEELKNEI